MLKSMRFIISFVIAVLIFTACKDKDLSEKDLTNVNIVREFDNSPVKENSSNTVTAQSDNGKIYNSPRHNTQSDEYHIIVASFSYGERNRAQKLVADLKEKGFPAKTIDSKKRLRVSIESFSNMEQANKARDEYRAITDRQDIWILKKE